jgi:hypothetical protein
MWLGRTRRTAWLMSIMFGSLLVMADTAARHDMASAAEQPPGWGRYRDRDFGMAFDFPAHIFSLKSAEQEGEGVVFSTPDDRARIRVFGFRNEANDTPRRYLSRIGNPEQARFTYVRTTPRFFVASGTRDGMISYRRCNFFRDKRVSCFQLDYPEGEKREWDNIVTRISLSLAAVKRRSEPNEDSLAVKQDSVGETIKAVNRSEPPAIGQPIIKQQRRPPPSRKPIVKQQRGDLKLVRSRSGNRLAVQKPRRYSVFAQKPRRYPAFTRCLFGIARTKCVNILVGRVGKPE